MSKKLNVKKNLNVNKTISTVMLFNMLQIGIVVALIIYNYFHGINVKVQGDGFWMTLFLYIMMGTAFVNSFLTMKDYKVVNNNTSQYDMLKESLEQVGELNKTLRGQRHDFMNHLQVVYGLIELGEYEEGKDYIEKVLQDIEKVNKVLKTLNPAVNALLQAKILYGEKRGIQVQLSVNTSLKTLKVPSWEFCRVLGNIMDNSIYALQEKKENRVMEVQLYEDQETYGFKIKNNGPVIPQKIINKIFESGVTTKGEKGEGMGLAIAKEILNGYGGNIKVSSSEENTIFEGIIPRV